ncbi:uncharacterized protein [Aegilops tauschii subsp. strangulata]|uniref:uncharacterized protein n=1 Tax=Aegilops tauschii subsp. strangulata TaxID=200361 RepID=UPI003CC878ED
MGYLMDVLTRYVESDSMKDHSSDDDKSTKGKKNGGGKGHQQNYPGHNGNNGNHCNGGKRKHPEGGLYLFANTNTDFKGQRWNNNSRRSYNGNRPRNYEEPSKPRVPSTVFQTSRQTTRGKIASSCRNSAIRLINITTVEAVDIQDSLEPAVLGPAFLEPAHHVAYLALTFRGQTVKVPTFRDLVGHNVHAYVDYILVKSRKKETMLADLKETFNNPRVYQMKLNLTKCVFDVPAGKPLGFLVSERGIEANQDKIKVATMLAKSANINDVQRVAGRIAFESLEQQLSTAPILAASINKEPMLLYIAANNKVVIVAVVVERKEAGKEYPVQRPVYYVREVLTESKLRYPHWQKLVFSVFMASRKLKHYFQEHPITMVSSSHLGDIIQNREAIGRVAKWAMELGLHHLKYVPQVAMKSQALVDFIKDWTENYKFPRKSQIIHIGRSTSSVPAEYEALLHGLRMAKEMNLSKVRYLGGSDLVAQQVSGTSDSNDPLMAAYRHAVTVIAGHFKGYQVDHIDCRLNEDADALSHLGSQRKPVPPNVFLDVLHNPSEEDIAILHPEAQLVAALHAIPDSTVPYLAYLTCGELPEDEIIARQIVRRSKSMTIVNGELHMSITGVFYRCVSPEEGHQILNEIHSGDCGHHADSRSLVAIAFRHGFYWLTAHVDAEDVVRKCDGREKFSRQAHVSAQELRMIPITWPFAV